ncbi:MAG: Ref family recombination enhancement nuclease [Candidatus Actinomarinaceae bacterium]
MKKLEREHLKKVAELGCIACAKLGYSDTPAEIHHIPSGAMGKKSDNFSVIPLCPHHHRTSNESYHLNPLWFSQTFGTQTELLEETLKWLK